MISRSFRQATALFFSSWPFRTAFVRRVDDDRPYVTVNQRVVAGFQFLTGILQADDAGMSSDRAMMAVWGSFRAHDSPSKTRTIFVQKTCA